MIKEIIKNLKDLEGNGPSRRSITIFSDGSGLIEETNSFGEDIITHMFSDAEEIETFIIDGY